MRCPDFFCLLIASSRGPSCFIIILYDVVPAKFLPFALGFPCTPCSYYMSCPPAAVSACWWSSIAPPPAGSPVLTRCLHRRLLHTPVQTHTHTHTELHTNTRFLDIRAQIQLLHTHMAYTHIHRQLLHTHTHCFYTHMHGFYTHTHTASTHTHTAFTHTWLLHTYTHGFYTHTHGFYTHTYTVFGPLLPGRGEFFICLGVCAHICTKQM